MGVSVLKKSAPIFLFGILALCNSAFAADIYFSNSAGGNITVAGNNANPCTLISPCNDLKGTTYDNANAISAGTTIWLDAGDDWTGSTAELRIISNGTASQYIKLKGYGASGKATLKGTTTYASGWTDTGVNNTWYIGGISWTESHIYIVMQNNTESLGKWGSGYGNTLNTSCPGSAFTNVANNTSCMPEGHFWFDASADRVYVHLWRNENPNTIGTVSLPTFATGPSSNDLRGLICTGCENGSYGDYIEIDMEKIEIVGAPGVGISFGGAFNKLVDTDTTDVDIAGTGKDGILHYYGQVSGENANDNIVDGIKVTYGASAGSGHGQSWTTYAPRTLWVNSACSNSWMACTDHLQGFDTPSDTVNSAIKNFTYQSCGQWGDRDGFDSCMYFDGGHDIVAKDFTIDNTLTGTLGNGNNNPRGGVRFGSEHPTTDPVINISLVNGLIKTSHDKAIQFQNIPSSTSNMKGIQIVHVTAIANRASCTACTFEQTLGITNVSSDADSLKIYNSILYGSSNSPINNWMTSDAKYDFDYIGYYRVGGNTTIYRDSNTGTNWNLAAWRTASGEDANSFYGNPYFVVDTEGSYDVHLQRTATGHANNSPAIDAGQVNVWSCPSFLYSQWPQYFPECAPGQQPIQGTTRTDSVADNMSVAPDLGYHYPIPTSLGPGTFTSASMVHSSSYTSTNGTLTVGATNQTAWPATGKIILTVDQDYEFNSGGTTAASCSSGCNGTLTINSISSNTVTMTRGGGATETAASTAMTIVLTNVQSPDTPQTTNTVTLQTEQSDGTIIDTKADIEGQTFSAPSLSTTIRITGGNFTLSGGSFNFDPGS